MTCNFNRYEVLYMYRRGLFQKFQLFLQIEESAKAGKIVGIGIWR